RFVHTLAPAMVRRRRGGFVLLSSIAGLQGNPRLAAYAASKAFNQVLGEGLWHELGSHGIDGGVSGPRATRTPNYLRTTKREAPGTLEPSEVAESTLAAMRHGPIHVPGRVNRLAAFVLRRLFTRRAAVKLMADSTRDLDDAD